MSCSHDHIRSRIGSGTSIVSMYVPYANSSDVAAMRERRRDTLVCRPRWVLPRRAAVAPSSCSITDAHGHAGEFLVAIVESTLGFGCTGVMQGTGPSAWFGKRPHQRAIFTLCSASGRGSVAQLWPPRSTADLWLVSYCPRPDSIAVRKTAWSSQRARAHAWNQRQTSTGVC